MPRPTILVVDDNPVIRGSYVELLTAEGYDVVAAQGGGQALAILDARKPDLVILDLVLHDMDGLTLCGKLRERPAGRSIPIVAVSGDLDRMEIAQGPSSGFTSSIFKPFSSDALLAEVHRLVAKNRTA